MKHLVIYSHPNQQSFNNAIMETFIGQLKIRQQDVRLRDLYAMDFNPVLRQNELEGFEKGLIPADVRSEQDHIRWADILTLICPIWWGGFTSILRGYFDRVFSLGFAYEETSSGVRGLLTEKRVFTINTIGAPGSVYEAAGLFTGMNKIMDEIIFQFCGIRVAGHQYFSFVDGCTDSQRKEMLEEVKWIADRLSDK